MLGAEIGVLLGAALLGGNLDHELMGIDGNRHLRHLRVVEELVEGIARLDVGFLLVERLRLAEASPRDGEELVGAGLVDRLLERIVRERPAPGLDKRLAGVYELPSGVRAVGAEHLGVDLGALLLHAHLDERLRELGLRVLRLRRVGERLGEAVEGVARLFGVAKRCVNRAEANVGVRRIAPFGIGGEIVLVALRGVFAERLELGLGLRHAAPAVAHEEEGLFPKEVVLGLVGLCERRIGERLVGDLRELAELLDAAHDLRGTSLKRGGDGLWRLVRLRAGNDVEALLLVHLGERHAGLLAGDAVLLDLDVLLHRGYRLGLFAKLRVAVGLLGVGGGVVDGVGVVFLDYLAELYRVTPAFAAHRLAEKLRSRVRGADVAAVVLQELAVEPVGACELAELLLERRKTQDGLAGHRHQLAVLEPREALGEIALDRVGVDAPVGGLGIFLVGLDEAEKTADHLFDRVDRLLDLGIAGENLEILLDRLLDLVLGHLLGRRAELHLANLGQLFGLDPRLDVGVVVLAREFAYLLRHLAGVGGPRGLGILDEDIERVVVRAEAVALAGRRLVAEEQRLDALVVALRLLVLGLRLVPQHLREHEAAERHRGELPEAFLALGVELDD